MSWWVTGAQVAGSLYTAKKSGDAAKDLAKKQGKLGSAMDLVPQQTEMDKTNQLWATDQNKANQLWASDQNWQNIEKSMEYNRPDWSREGFGGGSWNEENNQYDLTLDPTQKANLDILRGKQTGILSGMGEGFDVNGDVMNAYRDLQNPLVAESRDRENARLAAQGLSTGSGSAWQTAQRSINDAQTRADQNAILAGFEADQSLRQSNRADLGAMGDVENSMASNLQTPTFTAVGTPSVGAPSVSAPNASLYNAWTADQNAAQAGYANTLAKNQGYSDIAGSLGQLANGLFGGSGATTPNDTSGTDLTGAFPTPKGYNGLLNNKPGTTTPTV